MAAPGGLTPLDDLVSVSYQLINRNTLQVISHTGNYAEVNNSQFIFLKVHCLFTSFDKRTQRVRITFKQYTNFEYQVFFSESNAAHLISSNQIPLRKYTSDSIKCYEADITELVASDPTREYYFAITTSSNMSFYVNGSNKPSGSIDTYSADIGSFSPYYSSRIKSFSLRNYELEVDLFSLSSSHIFDLFSYSDELMSFNLSLISSFISKDSSNINQTLTTGFPKGFKLNVQQYIYSNGTNSYIYIDENGDSHIFKPFTIDNSDSIHYIDTNGSYLFMQVTNNGYQIYCLDGSIKTFSSHYLASETIKNGNNTSTISYQYSSNRLVSIVVNNNLSISLTYNTSSITISLPGLSSIILNFNSDNYLTSLIDQDNISYLIYYDNDINGLITAIELSANRKYSLSFNEQQMIEEVEILSYDSDNQQYESDANYLFIQHANSVTFKGDDNLFYSYEFDDYGQIVKTFFYKNSSGGILGANRLIETRGHRLYLSTNNPNFLKEITYNSSTHSYFESSVNLSSSLNAFSCRIKPKEQGLYFLYFEYERKYVSNYQSLNSLSISLSVGDNLSNAISVFSNKTISTSGFNETNIFMEPIFINEDLYSQLVNLSFAVSSGESTITIKNIRLYRLSDNNEYYGLNSYTGGNNLNLTNSDNITFYELVTNLQVQINNSSYEVSTSYDDLKASLVAHFFLNKNILFSNDGKKAYYGNISKSGISLSSFKLIKASYQNKRLSNDEHPYDSYSANIVYIDTTSFIEKSVQYIYAYQAETSSEKRYDSSFNLVSNKKTYPYGIVSHNNDVYTYGEYYLTAFYAHNSYGQITSSYLTAFKNDHLSSYFENSSETKIYSSDNKFLISNEQELYYNNSQTNDILFSYEYNSLGDMNKRTDAYNKYQSFSYNKHHSLVSLTAYNSGFYHNNNVSYNQTLEVTSVSSFNNQYLTAFTYDYKGRVKRVVHDSLNVAFTYLPNFEGKTYIEGNNSCSFSTTYSDCHLPLHTSVAGNTILVYHYVNKNTNTVGAGNPSSDYLESIFDYKNINSIKIKQYSYDEYGNLSSIIENGVRVDISSSCGVYSNTYLGHTSNAPFSAKNYIYTKGGEDLRTELIYSYVSDPFSNYKEINEAEYDSRTIIIKEGMNATDDGAHQKEILIWNGLNERVLSFSSTFSFFEDENNRHTSIVKNQEIKFRFLSNNSNTYSIDYSYDNKGNVVSVSSSSQYGITNTYSYNDFNELSGENNSQFGQINYSYDSHGNILTISRLSDSSITTFSYDSFNRLTSITKTVGLNTPVTLTCNGYTFGRPTTYKGISLAWDNLELADFGNTHFVYDGYGRRKSKTNTSLSRSVSYLYLETVLLEETVTETINNVQQIDTLRYLYDTNNEVIGFSMNDNTYLYVKDMFKNVIAITNQAGVEMCQYHYDAYGNFIITPSIAGGEILGNLNPIRYRSYYYDKETGLYYLKTRYYDPETCRFISMDDISYLDPQTLNGLNLYCYCLNNPIMYRDENGTSGWSDFWSGVEEWFSDHWAELVIGTAFVVAGALVTAATCGTGTSFWAAFGGAILNSLVQTSAGIVAGVTINGLNNLSSGVSFFENVGDTIASSFMLSGIISGSSQIIGGGLRLLRHHFGFYGINVGSIRLFSPDKEWFDVAGGTIFKCDAFSVDVGRYSLHMHTFLTGNCHVPLIPVICGVFEYYKRR